ncbi:MAG: LysR family transcriptional regulator [Burkholderiaceae bacterium]|nr:LysR family transcriptional regulator [Burkholderiaceae bacterium]
MSLDLRALRSFIAIAAAGSITRAAENVHMAQPALSVLLRQLEEQLGAVLFERTYRGVKLTMAGERFLSHAREIIKRVDVAVEDVREAVAEPTGRVALGMPQTVHSYASVLGYQSLENLSILKITKPPITRSVYLCRSSTTPQSIATSVTHDFLKQYASRLVQTNEWPTTVSSN